MPSDAKDIRDVLEQHKPCCDDPLHALSVVAHDRLRKRYGLEADSIWNSKEPEATLLVGSMLWAALWDGYSAGLWKLEVK